MIAAAELAITSVMQADRFESAAAAMHAADQDFYSEEIASLRDAARAVREKLGNGNGEILD